MAVPDIPRGICAFSISPTYLFLHRLLYYLCLLASLLYPTPPPLLVGAFAYCLTTSAIAAIYSILIRGFGAGVDKPQNLDVLPLWGILSLASISLVGFLNWNRNVTRRNAARPILRVWGILILGGTTCAFVNLRVYHEFATLLRNSYDEQVENNRDFEYCRGYGSWKGWHSLRNSEHITLLEPTLFRQDAWKRVWDVTPPVTFIWLAVGALACVVHISPSEKKEREFADPGLSITDDLLENRRGKAFDRVLDVYLKLRSLLLAITPATWIVVLVLNEILLWRPEIPLSERMEEVGQWGAWAGLGLVVVAGLIYQLMPKPKLRKFSESEGHDTLDFRGVGTVV